MGRLTETVENRFHVVADRAEVFVTKHARSMILATGLAISAVSGAAVVGESIIIFPKDRVIQGKIRET